LVRSDRTERSSVAAGHRRTRRPGCGPRNRRSRGVVLGRRARRLSRGSVDGPFGTAQDFRTPSTSSRKSKCRLEESCRWITNRGRPPGSPPPGSPETSRLRFARYARSASSLIGRKATRGRRRLRIVGPAFAPDADGLLLVEHHDGRRRPHDVGAVDVARICRSIDPRLALLGGGSSGSHVTAVRVRGCVRCAGLRSHPILGTPRRDVSRVMSAGFVVVDGPPQTGCDRRRASDAG
jgi:hypothetical protein